MSYDVKMSGERIRYLRIKAGLHKKKLPQFSILIGASTTALKPGKRDVLLTCSCSFQPYSMFRLIILSWGRYSKDLIESADNSQIKADIEKLIAHLEQFKIML